MGPVLELRGIVKEFAAHRVVDNISLTLDPGRFYSLLGASGCGKTTTLRLIAGFETPTEGQILLQGSCINDLAPYRRNVSTVFQSYALFPHLNAERNVAFGLEQSGRKDVTKKVMEALEMVQLSGKSKRFPAQLSGGEKQRVALARSLVLEPAVLLLDEPLAALDLQLRKAMRTELKEMQRRTGVTFLFVTHDQEEALAMSDEIAIMNNGRIEQRGAPRDVYRHPATRYVADFLGEMNWIDGVGVRPEAMRLSAHETGVRCSAEVTESMFFGNIAHVLMRFDSGERVKAEVPAHAAEYRTGDRVGVSWSTADEVRFPE